jgi:predicted nucleotide-binding protein
MRAVQGSAVVQAQPTLAAVKPSKKMAKAASAPKPIKQTRNNSVFVVHGRDTKLNEDIFNFLRTLGLNPMEWSHAIAQAKGANPNIGQTINSAMKRVQAVVVMFSPDEDAKLKSKFCAQNEKATLGKAASQARPNVLFEAGLALGAHPDKTLLIQVGEMREIRVRTHYSHQIIAAARLTALMKFRTLRSKRVAMRRQSLKRQNMRSMTLRCL